MAKDIPVIYFVPLLIKKKKRSYWNIWNTPKVPVRWAKSNIRSINRGGTRGSWKYSYNFLSTTIVFVRESYDEKTAVKSLASTPIVPTRHELHMRNSILINWSQQSRWLHMWSFLNPLSQTVYHHIQQSFSVTVKFGKCFRLPVKLLDANNIIKQGEGLV